MSDRPPDMREPDAASEAAVLIWMAGFLITLVLFIAYCWWKAHTGAA